MYHDRFDAPLDQEQSHSSLPIKHDALAPRSNRHSKLRRLSGRVASLLLSGALLGGAAAGSFYGVNQLLPDSSNGQTVSAQTTSGVLTSLGSTNISVQEVRSYFNRFGPNGAGQTQMEETTSCGSGVIFSMDDTYLYIVTNQHVVDGATNLSVSFVDNAVCEAQLCGTDADVDIAVLKVALSNLSADTLSQITVIPIGNSDELDVGEQVVAIGNALGYGQSVTTGIVSALDRALTSENGTTSTYIQTDAAINPGNSGGALLNLDGELIGINTAKLSDTDVEGMGYAIPISDVADLISELMTQTTDLSQTSATQSSYYGASWNRA